MKDTRLIQAAALADDARTTLADVLEGSGINDLDRARLDSARRLLNSVVSSIKDTADAP